MVKAYEPLYTVKEAAKVLKVNVSAVYRLINTKQLVGLRLGSVKVRGSDLERFLEQYPALNPEEAKEGEMEGEQWQRSRTMMARPAWSCLMWQYRQPGQRRKLWTG